MRDKLVDVYLSALQTLKLFQDDLYVIAIEAIDVQITADPRRRNDALGSFGRRYLDFLRAWIRASPLIHPQSPKYIDLYWPERQVRDHLNSPFLRSFRVPIPEIALPADWIAPRELAQREIEGELARLRTDAKATSVSTRVVHLLGVAFVLAQVELALRWALDQTDQTYVKSWYDEALKPLAVIRDEIVGFFDTPVRQAIRDSDDALAQRLEGARNSMLTSIATIYSYRGNDTATLLGFSKGPAKPSEIIGVNRVTEKLTSVAGLIRADTKQNRAHAQGYLARVGFPLTFGQLDARGQLKLAPRWRRTLPGMRAAAFREQVEHDNQQSFSVPEIIVKQHELIANLLRFDTVRADFAKPLKKTPSLALIDRKVRGPVLAAVFRALLKKQPAPQALSVLIGLVQRYLGFFTRHTGDNLRDGDPSYLISKWPTDMNGRLFFDCGVYAVETANDLNQVAREGITLEFRFMLFIGHICLVVYFDQTSFLVNNATITQPKPIGRAAPGGDAKIDAALSWAPQAMSDVFHNRFSIALAAPATKMLKSRLSATAFQADIWTMYKSLMGLDIIRAIHKRYYDSVDAFDAGSTLLLGYLMVLGGISAVKLSVQDLAKYWNEATALALGLYRLAEIIAHPYNYIFKGKVQLKTAFMQHMRGNDELLTRVGVQELPMYTLVRKLLEREKAGQTLSADQKTLSKMPVGNAHLRSLAELQPQDKCSVQEMTQLAAIHEAQQVYLYDAAKRADPKIVALVGGVLTAP